MHDQRDLTQDAVPTLQRWTLLLPRRHTKNSDRMTKSKRGVHPEHWHKETKMKPIAFAAIALLASAVSVHAEIMCTQHGGCRETGRRIISGDSGGVTSQQHITSHRDGKPKRVRIIRTYYDND